MRATLFKRYLVPRIAKWWFVVHEYVGRISGGKKHVTCECLKRNPVRELELAMEMGVQVGSLGEEACFLTFRLPDYKAQQNCHVLKGGYAALDVKKDFRVKNVRLYRGLF